MAGYIGPVPTPQATQSRDYFTATAGQTSFPTSGYTPGYLDVYLNGVHLQDSDFTATNGSDVVLNDPCAADDVVLVVAWSTFEATNVDYSNVQNTPTNVSDFTNDAGYATTSYVDTAESDAVAAANAYTDTEISNLDALPSQTGNSGKYLTTDGTNASWGTIADEIVKSASDPTLTSNYPLGTVWANTTSGEMYICTDATANANVWINVGEGVDNIAPINASGGIELEADGYGYHIFKSSSTFILNSNSVDIDYLIVAGGGGGGGGNTGSAHGGGGGGAGGMLSGTSTITNGSYSITVGSGGSGAAVNASGGGNGGNSAFNSLTAIGGGGGGSRMGNESGLSGGSGGGSTTTGSPGSGTAGQGNAGGDGQDTGAGGGGKGAAGANVASNIPTPGGIGGVWSAITTTIASAQSVGEVSGSDVYFAGGGGGGCRSGVSVNAAGGLGGGGKGGKADTNDATAGDANTGGGGGAGSNPQPGRNGGSGIVIIRYAI
jgi:hypothetical protein